MSRTGQTKGMTRRSLVKYTVTLAGGAALMNGVPWLRAGHAASLLELDPQAPAGTDPLEAMRAQFAAVPIQREALTGNLTMLSGPGGNVLVVHGPDGKVLVDGFVQTVWTQLKTALDGIGSTPIKALIDTHWHVDHSDNNANVRAAGAEVIAHDNTGKRLSESHNLFGTQFPPAPAAAQPTKTFAQTHRIEANGETIELGYVPPAHTDTDIYVRCTKSNVLHLGDLFFNGTYPFIDAGTGGSITGMIAGADLALGLADSATKIIPGHGPLGDKAALTKYRDVLVTVRDRVQKQKTAGRTVEEVVAAKPTADLDAVWGKGFMQPDIFVRIVYSTL